MCLLNAFDSIQAHRDPRLSPPKEGFPDCTLKSNGVGAVGGMDIARAGSVFFILSRLFKPGCIDQMGYGCTRIYFGNGDSVEQSALRVLHGCGEQLLVWAGRGPPADAGFGFACLACARHFDGHSWNPADLLARLGEKIEAVSASQRE